MKICVICGFFLISGRAFSEVKEGKWKSISSPVKLNFELSVGYDNNIFKFSPSDIDKFVNNQDTIRFVRVESYDDFVTHRRVTTELLMGGTRLRFKYNSHQYAVNPIKNYQSIVLNLRQRMVGGNTALQIGYLFIPQYYIRDYYDKDFRTWMRCDFREHLIALKPEMRILRKTHASLIYKFEVIDYNSYFNEYDTRSNLFGANLSHRFKGLPLKIEIEYLYKNAIAKAYDEPGETPLSSDESDISYNGNEVKIDLKLNLVNVVYEYEVREYTTKKSIQDDPFHRDREDRKHTFSGGLEFKITRKLLANLSYTYIKRNTDSPKKAEITEVKDYTSHIISAGLGFKVGK